MIATSDQEIEELLTGGVPRAKIVLRRNGVEAPESWPERGTFRRAQGVSNDEKLVLFLGRLSAKKSPELLLRAFAELSEQFTGKPLRLVFAGPDEGGVKAQLELATLYSSGRGVTQDMQQAAAWFRRAAGVPRSESPHSWPTAPEGRGTGLRRHRVLETHASRGLSK